LEAFSGSSFDSPSPFPQLDLDLGLPFEIPGTNLFVAAEDFHVHRAPGFDGPDRSEGEGLEDVGRSLKSAERSDTARRNSSWFRRFNRRSKKATSTSYTLLLSLASPTDRTSGKQGATPHDETTRGSLMLAFHVRRYNSISAAGFDVPVITEPTQSIKSQNQSYAERLNADIERI
jgi:hypothetical protein